MINLFLHSHIKFVFTGTELSLLSGMEGIEIEFNMDHRHFHTLTQWPFNTEFFGLHFSHLNTIKNGWFLRLKRNMACRNVNFLYDLNTMLNAHNTLCAFKSNSVEIQDKSVLTGKRTVDNADLVQRKYYVDKNTK